jgi:hypothetical protein
MVKDETCYNLNGFIKKIKFLTKKVINIYIYFGKIKNNWIYAEATKVL